MLIQMKSINSTVKSGDLFQLRFGTKIFTILNENLAGKYFCMCSF